MAIPHYDLLTFCCSVTFAPFFIYEFNLYIDNLRLGKTASSKGRTIIFLVGGNGKFSFANNFVLIYAPLQSFIPKAPSCKHLFLQCFFLGAKNI